MPDLTPATDVWREATGRPTERHQCQFLDLWTGARYDRQINPDWSPRHKVWGNDDFALYRGFEPGWVWVGHPVEPFVAWHEGEIMPDA